MIPRFRLARPTTLEEAFAAHAATEGDGAYVAGGTELLQVMKMGFAQVGTLIDLKRITALRGIGIDDDGRLRIGATTTHRDVERSAIVRDTLPALAALERDIANVRVRNTGTLGGNLAFAEPHSDPGTLLLAAGATVELASPRGPRELGMDAFVVGPLMTAREPEEILVSIRIPRRAPDEGYGYRKIAFFERPAASVAVRVRIQDGRVVDATVAVGSLTETPTLVDTAAAELVGETVDHDHDDVLPAAVEAIQAVDAFDDLNGSAEYKRHLAGVLMRRAFRDAVREARADA